MLAVKSGRKNLNSSFLRIILLLVFFSVWGTALSWAVPVRYIVTFVEETPLAVQERIIEESGSSVLNRIPLLNAWIIELPADRAEESLNSLQSQSEVKEIERDTSIKIQNEGGIQGPLVVPVDPEPVEGGYTWNLLQIYLDEVHPKAEKKKEQRVKVAVLDTGIDASHPDLAGVVVGGYNARAGEDETDYMDRNGHGTHIAGIIAAAAGKPEEWRAMRGIAPQAALYAVRVLQDDGGGYLSDLINGLSWVYEHPKIRVVNMSLGFYEGSPLLHKVIQLLYKSGVVMVASAGNYDSPVAHGEGGEGEGGEGEGGEGEGGEGEGGESEGGEGAEDCINQTVKYPARYPETIGVGATDSEAKITYYSINGPEVDLVAPGGTRSEMPIVSTIPYQLDETSGKVTQGEGGEGEGGEGEGGEGNVDKRTYYGLGSGTSQAAAHVTGVVALMLNVNPKLTPEAVLEILQKTAMDLGASSEAQGAGLIDAALAVDMAMKWR